MILNWEQATTNEKEIVKDHRRKGLFTKQQLEVIDQLDDIDIKKYWLYHIIK